MIPATPPVNYAAEALRKPDIPDIPGLDCEAAVLALQDCDPDHAIHAMAAAGVRVHPGPGERTFIYTSTCSMTVMTKGGLWFDFTESQGGRGALSLLQAALAITPQEAARFFAQWAHRCPEAKALKEAAALRTATRNPSPAQTPQRGPGL